MHHLPTKDMTSEQAVGVVIKDTPRVGGRAERDLAQLAASMAFLDGTLIQQEIVPEISPGDPAKRGAIKRLLLGIWPSWNSSHQSEQRHPLADL